MLLFQTKVNDLGNEYEMDIQMDSINLTFIDKKKHNIKYIKKYGII